MLAIVAAVVLSQPLLAHDGSRRTKSLPNHLWGVTLDDVTAPGPIANSLAGLRTRPMARIVFDPGVSAAYYSPAVGEIGKVADIMGTPIDSAPPSGQMSVDAYRQRMVDYMNGLGDRVDIWEIGNEVNGDWTGDSTLMGQKVGAAFEEAHNRQERTALTLTYSDIYCGTDRDMGAWSRKYLSPAVRDGVDYVLVSFYTDTATGRHPDWSAVFQDLAETFPHSKLGFGELGLRKADFSLSSDPFGKADLIRRYYRMPSPLGRREGRRYVGGYFWWSYKEDATSKDSMLWKTFHDVIR